MARSEFKAASIRCTFDYGLDDAGKMKKKVKSYHNVTEAAQPTEIYNAVQVLTELGTKPLLFLEKQSGLSIFQ